MCYTLLLSQLYKCTHSGASLVHSPKDAQTVEFLRFGFTMDYDGPVLTPTSANHPSANTHLTDVAVYITKALAQGSYVGTFQYPHFVPWYQINPLLTRHKTGQFQLSGHLGHFLATLPSSQCQWGYSKGHLVEQVQENASSIGTRPGLSYMASEKGCLPLQFRHHSCLQQIGHWSASKWGAGFPQTSVCHSG